MTDTLFLPLSEVSKRTVSLLGTVEIVLYISKGLITDSEKLGFFAEHCVLLCLMPSKSPEVMQGSAMHHIKD